jgi:Multicopper oxidase
MLRSCRANVRQVIFAARYGPHLGNYMMHCHNIVHEDKDMLRAFLVRLQCTLHCVQLPSKDTRSSDCAVDRGAWGKTSYMWHWDSLAGPYSIACSFQPLFSLGFFRVAGCERHQGTDLLGHA